MRNFKSTTGAALGESVKGCRSVGIPLAVLGFLAGLLLSMVQPPPALAQQSTRWYARARTGGPDHAGRGHADVPPCRGDAGAVELGRGLRHA